MNSRVLIEGIMPYRALNRLHREGIFVKKAKKIEKNQIICTVDAKDVEKIFAIYPKMCYNESRYTPYTVQLLPLFGWGKVWNSVKNRMGLFVGCGIFLLATAFSDKLVLRTELVGETGYRAQVEQILQSHGVKSYAVYPVDKTDRITADVLRLDGVSFCSVKKVGSTLVVEVRCSPFAPTEDEEDKGEGQD